MKSAPATNIKEHQQHQQHIFSEAVSNFTEELPQDIQEKLRRIVGLAEPLANSRILDVGTGTGALIPFFEEHTPQHIVGCDLTQEMLDEAAKLYPHCEYWCGDIIEYPQTSQPFHAIFMNGMFGNVWDQYAVLKKIQQLLEVQGRAVISHPLGATFVQGLREAYPNMVKHLLPSEETLHTWTDSLAFELVHFEDTPDFYAAILQKVRT